MTITAMTYNICSGLNLKRERDIEFAASVIRSIGPDFVGVNEVRHRAADADYQQQARLLGEALGMYHTFGRSIDIAGGEYGNAFLSRHPILSSEVIHIPDAPERERLTHFEHRTLLRSVIEIHGRRVVVLVSHYGLSPEEQREAVSATVRQLALERDPVVFMGDLNARPGGVVLAPLYAALQDTAGGREELLTFPSDLPTAKIDYIFTSAHFAVLNAWSPGTQASDHRPLLARLELA